MTNDSKRVALVTGGTSGIGLAVTRTLASQGHSVFMCSRSASDVESVSASLRGEGLQVDGAACDVRQVDDIKAYVEAAMSLHGRVDVLVNNAGRSGGGVTADIADDLWLDVIETN